VGTRDHPELHTYRKRLRSNERNDVDILRRRMDANVVLIETLGGGWNAANLPKL